MSSHLATVAIVGKHFEEFKDELEGAIARRLGTYLSIRIEVGEIIGLVFEKAQKKLSKNPDAPINEWYFWYKLARDCIVERIRYHLADKRDVRKCGPFPVEDLRDQLVQSITSPSQRAHKREMNQKLYDALDEFSELEQEILWMRYRDNLKWREIAEVVEIDKDTVRQQHNRSIGRLRTALT